MRHIGDLVYEAYRAFDDRTDAGRKVGEVLGGGARGVSVAVADALVSTIAAVEPTVRAVFCAMAQAEGPFAAASDCRRWRDLADEDVAAMLRAAPIHGDSPRR
jgi:predicted phosphoribosyltransferase